MPELNFHVEGAEAVPFAAAPLLALKLRVEQRAAGEVAPVHTVALCCQIRIEPGRRRYDAGYGVRSLDEIHAVIAFFEERCGRLYGFRWKDHADWKSCAPL